MGRLIRVFPPRMLDPLYRTQTYVDRRRGMPDPEHERRLARADAERPLPVVEAQDIPNVETVLYGSTSFNPVSQAAGGGESKDVTVTGIDGAGGWVCAAGLTSLPTNWTICANATAGDTCTVRVVNTSGATADPGSGTLTCRCAKAN